jgi:hypothetical protein
VLHHAPREPSGVEQVRVQIHLPRRSTRRPASRDSHGDRPRKNAPVEVARLERGAHLCLLAGVAAFDRVGRRTGVCLGAAGYRRGSDEDEHKDNAPERR